MVTTVKTASSLRIYKSKQIKFKLLNWVFHATSSPQRGQLSFPTWFLTETKSVSVGSSSSHPPFPHFWLWTFHSPLPRLEESLHLCKWKADTSFLHGSDYGPTCFTKVSLTNIPRGVFSVSTVSQLYSKILHAIHIVYHLNCFTQLHGVLQTRL